MEKRVTVIFCFMVLMMTTAMFRIYYIEASDYLTQAASVQGEYELVITRGRGAIYDRSFQPLVNDESAYLAAILPTPQTAAVLLELAPEEEREALLQRLTAGMPFVLEVENKDLYADGIEIFRVPVRYGQTQLAPHVVGYLGGDAGGGAAGVERAYNDLLSGSGLSISAIYRMDAGGRILYGDGAGIERQNEDSMGGVVLTLDKDIQQVVQDAFSVGWDKGAVVVMEIETGNILAMASFPTFDQNDIAASLASEDAPFINRAISGYNIGSVFKVIVSAAALETGISPYYPYECEGYVDIGGQIFRCNNNAVHGSLDMKRALEVSCNTYFINLAEEIGSRPILSLCENMGLGKAVELAPGMYTQAGNLPTVGELVGAASLANFSFGQGSSLASPLQMTQAISVIAGGGGALPPRLVQGITENGAGFSSKTPTYAANPVLRPETSQTLRELMVAVIEEGSGKPARPLHGGAGGKTSSAQTGQTDPETGKEIVHAWFGGFCPADHPKYAIVVFCEGGESGERVAAPIFKQIVDGMSALGY